MRPKGLASWLAPAARVGVGAVALAGAAAACPPGPQDGRVLDGGAGITLAWRSTPEPIPRGQPFTLQVRLCPANGVLGAADATMPEHGHGMNYRARVQPLGDGRFEVRGLLWHMPGRWELRFDVRPEAGAPRQVLRQSVVLE